MKTKGKQDSISDAYKKEFQSKLDMPPIRATYIGSGKLAGKAALVTGGDSGIGRAIAVHYAREGADVAIAYLKNDEDAADTEQMVKAEGVKCLLLKGDISKERTCYSMISKVIKQLGKLDILVNNAGMHQEDDDISDISAKQLQRTFEVNTFSMFYLAKAALEYMQEGCCIINTASVTAYRGSEHLMDYAATKGAIVSFTRSLAGNLASKKIRVNAVAPGPVWTPLVVYAFDKKELRKFGKDTPLGRAGYPYEMGPAYVYLASEDSSYMTGQTLHINGGDTVTS